MYTVPWSTKGSRSLILFQMYEVTASNQYDVMCNIMHVTCMVQEWFKFHACFMHGISVMSINQSRG